MSQRPGIDVAVVMRKIRTASPWQAWRWELAEVIAQEPAFGSEPRKLVDTANEQRWLFPGFRAELFTDDCEGYYLNYTTDRPGWFVMWRMEEEASLSDEALARPVAVSLSYHDAGRWLDAQENCEQVPAPPDVIAWMREFAEAHYVPEPRKRQRPESFRKLEDRFGNPASVSTGKGRGNG
jgi:hypothetical protein